MLISQPRISRDLQQIRKDILLNAEKQIKVLQKQYTTEIKEQIKEHNVKFGSFTTTLLMHVETYNELAVIEKWLEQNATHHVKITEAKDLNYDTDCDMEYEFDDCEDNSNVEEKSTTKDETSNIKVYGEKTSYQYPTYEFTFVSQDDAMRFKLTWG